eukprot:1801540-Rhodomonas_salina.2
MSGCSARNHGPRVRAVLESNSFGTPGAGISPRIVLRVRDAMSGSDIGCGTARKCEGNAAGEAPGQGSGFCACGLGLRLTFLIES